MATTNADYDQLAADNGWSITRGISIQGLPCTVWQRGRDEVLVHLDQNHEGYADVLRHAPSGYYNGRRVEDIAEVLEGPAPQHLLTSHIVADKAGIIANLAAMSVERKISSGTRGTQRESRRLADEAQGLELAIDILQAWEVETDG